MLFTRGKMLFWFVTILIFFQNGNCQNSKSDPDPEFSTFVAPNEDKKTLELRNALKEISKPVLKSELLQKDWLFSPGDPEEALLTKISFKPEGGAYVDLPHSIFKPDTPLWYSKTINIPSSTIIQISADDGAQLFINGIQQKRIEGEIFEINAVGTVHISVRVLNNAMSGGLKKIAVVSRKDYEKYKQAKKLYDRFQLIGNKLIQFRNPETAMIVAVMEALDKKEKLLLRKAEAHFEEYPFFVAGPYLQKHHKDSLTILLETDRSCKCSLLTGKTEEYLNIKMEGSEEKFMHGFSLPVGNKDTLLFYRLKCNNTYSKVFRVKSKEDPETFSFNIWADSQGGWPIFDRFMQNVEKSEDAFGIGVGDLVNNGAEPQAWQSFFSTLGKAGAKIPFYLILGNHDYDGYYDDLQPSLFKKYIRNGENPTYYSWTHGNCAFIALDPNLNFPIGIPEGSPQYKWFLNQLGTEEWLNADWRFVLVHQPPYSQGWEGYHGEDSIRKIILANTENGKIDFVISGHTHDYERLSKNIGSQIVNFMIVGGAGGSLEPEASSEFPKMDKLIKAHHIARFHVSGKKLAVKILGLENELLDSFEVKK